MWAVIKGFLSTHILKLIGYGAAILSVLAVLFGARQAGKNAEKVSNYERTLKVVRKKNETENAVDSADDAERQRLRAKWTRRR